MIWLDAQLPPSLAPWITENIGEPCLAVRDVHHAPPKIIWLTCGNTSKQRLKEIMASHLRYALSVLESGSDLIEIN